jgi:alkylhydroperoxidase family enzyme
MNGRIKPAATPFEPEIAQTLDTVMRGAAPVILFTTLARNPRVFQRFMAGGLLDKGSIGLREREVMIDRTTALCGSEYEWGVHVAFFAEAAGLTAAQVAATTERVPDESVWNTRERLIVRLADSLHDRATVDEELWTELAQEFSAEQLLELIVLAGFYRTVSYLTNALALPLEAGAAHFSGGILDSIGNAGNVAAVGVFAGCLGWTLDEAQPRFPPGDRKPPFR